MGDPARWCGLSPEMHGLRTPGDGGTQTCGEEYPWTSQAGVKSLKKGLKYWGKDGIVYPRDNYFFLVRRQILRARDQKEVKFA